MRRPLGGRIGGTAGGKRAPTLIHVQISLADVERQIDECLERETGIAGHIERYGRAHALVLGYRDKRRKTVINSAAARAVTSGVNRDPVVRIVAVSKAPVMINQIRGNTVRAVSPKLWEASKVSTTRLHVKTIQTITVAAPRTASVNDLIATMRTDAVQLSHAREAEQRARSAIIPVLTDFAAASIWDSETERLATNDGWLIGYETVEQFNAKRAADLAPEFGIDIDAITTQTPRAGSVRYTLAGLDSDEDDGDEYVE